MCTVAFKARAQAPYVNAQSYFVVRNWWIIVLLYNIKPQTRRLVSQFTQSNQIKQI